MYGLLIPTKENGHNPPVKSVSLRKPGQVKGTRLVVYQSLIDYLHGQVEQFQQSMGKEVQKWGAQKKEGPAVTQPNPKKYT